MYIHVKYYHVFKPGYLVQVKDSLLQVSRMGFVFQLCCKLCVHMHADIIICHHKLLQLSCYFDKHELANKPTNICIIVPWAILYHPSLAFKETKVVCGHLKMQFQFQACNHMHQGFTPFMMV